MRSPDWGCICDEDRSITARAIANILKIIDENVTTAKSNAGGEKIRTNTDKRLTIFTKIQMTSNLTDLV